MSDVYTNTEVDYMYNDDESYNTFHGNIKGPKKSCGNCTDCKCKPKKESKTNEQDLLSRLKVIQALVNSAVEELRK